MRQAATNAATRPARSDFMAHVQRDHSAGEIEVIHALEATKPQPRYYVTFPTYLFGILKRILSTRALDVLLAKSGNSN